MFVLLITEYNSIEGSGISWYYKMTQDSKYNVTIKNELKKQIKSLIVIYVHLFCLFILIIMCLLKCR